MEMTHTYATLRVKVPVEGKKVYSLLPILLNHPFTHYNIVNIANRAWETRKGDLLFLRKKETREERQKSYNWERGELGVKEREKSSIKGQGFRKGPGSRRNIMTEKENKNNRKLQTQHHKTHPPHSRGTTWDWASNDHLRQWLLAARRGGMREYQPMPR